MTIVISSRPLQSAGIDKGRKLFGKRKELDHKG